MRLESVTLSGLLRPPSRSPRPSPRTSPRWSAPNAAGKTAFLHGVSKLSGVTAHSEPCSPRISMLLPTPTPMIDRRRHCSSMSW
jgi:hypothetical protein